MSRRLTLNAGHRSTAHYTRNTRLISLILLYPTPFHVLQTYTRIILLLIWPKLSLFYIFSLILSTYLTGLTENQRNEEISNVLLQKDEWRPFWWHLKCNCYLCFILTFFILVLLCFQINYFSFFRSMSCTTPTYYFPKLLQIMNGQFTDFNPT